MARKPLDGLWDVRRTGGLLPPLIGVKKRISGGRGETRIGSLIGVAFDVVGTELRYDRPFTGFVDVLEPDAEGFTGRATFRGRTFGHFVLRPIVLRQQGAETRAVGGPGVGPPGT